MALANIFGLLGGIGLFLYGMKLMSDGLQDLAGDRMRRLVGALTSTPLRGVAIGTLVTMVVQSSSCTTVMVVSFVQAGLMKLQQALAVCMGANIGTTITAQLIAFHVSDYALPIIAVGMAMALFGMNKKQRYVGNCLFGFGLLFLGLNYMSQSMSFMRTRQDIFLAFGNHPLLGVLAGTVLTMVVQSSSATVGLTIAMATQGLLPLNAAIPILLGDNLGTTITAVLASLASSREAKQAALGHVLNKLIGVIIVLPFLGFTEHLVSLTSPNIARQVANAHTLFNLFNTLVLFPFIGPLARFVQRVLPAEEREIFDGPRYLDEHLLDVSPAGAVQAVKQEMVRAGKITLAMVHEARNAIINGEKSSLSRLIEQEKMVNELNHAVAAYAARLWHRHISPDLSVVMASYVNGMGDVERIGDHCDNLREMAEHVQDSALSFTDEGRGELKEIFNLAIQAVDSAISGVENEDLQAANHAARELEDQIDQMEQTLRDHHIKRLNQGICSAEAGIAFVDILSNLERIGDHAHNIAMIVRDLERLQGHLPPRELAKGE